MVYFWPFLKNVCILNYFLNHIHYTLNCKCYYFGTCLSISAILTVPSSPLTR